MNNWKYMGESVHGKLDIYAMLFKIEETEYIKLRYCKKGDNIQNKIHEDEMYIVSQIKMINDMINNLK